MIETKKYVVEGKDVYVMMAPLKEFISNFTLEAKMRICTNAIAACGALAFHIHENDMAAIADQLSNGVFENNTERYVAALMPGHYINLYTDILAGLNEEELNAILMHEIGHVVDGIPKGSEKVEGTTVAIDLQAELNADEYAIKTVSPQLLHRSLVKVIESSSSFIKKLNPEHDAEKYIIDCLNHSVMAERLRVLESKF